MSESLLRSNKPQKSIWTIESKLNIHKCIALNKKTIYATISIYETINILFKMKAKVLEHFDDVCIIDFPVYYCEAALKHFRNKSDLI